MTHRILSFAVALAMTGSLIRAASVDGLDGFKSDRLSARRLYAFTLKATGAFDPEFLFVTFDGQATHLGHVTASGQYVPDWHQFWGTITTNQGDTAVFIITFSEIPGLHGQLPAQLQLNSGTGALTNLRAAATGSVTVDDDYSLTLRFDGVIGEPGPCFSEPCFDVAQPWSLDGD